MIRLLCWCFRVRKKFPQSAEVPIDLPCRCFRAITNHNSSALTVLQSSHEPPQGALKSRLINPVGASEPPKARFTGSVSASELPRSPKEFPSHDVLALSMIQRHQHHDPLSLPMLPSSQEARNEAFGDLVDVLTSSMISHEGRKTTNHCIFQCLDASTSPKLDFWRGRSHDPRNISHL